jgi:hypothetical protein
LLNVLDVQRQWLHVRLTEQEVSPAAFGLLPKCVSAVFGQRLRGLHALMIPCPVDFGKGDRYTVAAMNSEASTPPPVPMVKEATVKDDGRFLFYYTFPDTPRSAGPGEKDPEDADV